MFEHKNENVKMQYELLNILDSKASALLTFNAVALASVAIWLGYVPLNYLHLALDLVFLVLLFSCASLLRIIWLRWASAEDNEEALNRTRVHRTRQYRIAWRLSIFSILFLIIISVLHTVGTLLSSTNSCGGTCRTFYSEEIFGNLDYRS